jgi:hypothetical protein
MNSDEIKELVDETGGPLIAGSNVAGTSVKRASGEKIGQIQDIMISKSTGQAEFAVLNFGGFLGMFEEAYPLEWRNLKYNTELDAFELNMSDGQLKSLQGGPASHYVNKGQGDSTGSIPNDPRGPMAAGVASI